jgi:hypothetical protein
MQRKFLETHKRMGRKRGPCSLCSAYIKTLSIAGYLFISYVVHSLGSVQHGHAVKDHRHKKHHSEIIIKNPNKTGRDFSESL